MAAADLRTVDEARSQVVRDIVCPPGFEAVAATAAGLNVAGVGLLLGGTVAMQVIGLVFVLVGAAAVGWSARRFRDANGVWVSGYRRGGTRPTTMVFGAVQVLAISATAAAALALGWWWVGIALAPLLMVAFVVVNRRWMRLYRAEVGLIG